VIKKIKSSIAKFLKKYGMIIFIFIQIDMLMINLFFLYLTYKGFECMSNKAKLQRSYEQFIIANPKQ